MLNQRLLKNFRTELTGDKKKLLKVLSEMYTLDFQKPFTLIDLKRAIPLKGKKGYSLHMLSQYFEEKKIDTKDKRILYISFVQNCSTPVHVFELVKTDKKDCIDIRNTDLYEVLDSPSNRFLVTEVKGKGNSKCYFKPSFMDYFGKVVVIKSFILVVHTKEKAVKDHVKAQNEAFIKGESRLKNPYCIASYSFKGNIVGGASKVTIDHRYWDYSGVVKEALVDKSGYYSQKAPLYNRLIQFKREKFKNEVKNGAFSKEIAEIDAEIEKVKKRIKENVKNSEIDEHFMKTLAKVSDIFLSVFEFRRWLVKDESYSFFNISSEGKKGFLTEIEKIKAKLAFINTLFDNLEKVAL